MASSAPNPLPAVVIGAGISGLACAHRLRQLGISATVLESSARIGGSIWTVEQDGFRFELGPQSFLSTPALLALIEQLGLTSELLRAPRRAPRYILAGGRLVPAPFSPWGLMTTPLFGARTKWRLVTEIFRRTHPPEQEESVAAFIRRKFGADLLDRIAGPFVSGIYAGDPERLSWPAAFPMLHEHERKYGSVVRGALAARPKKGAPKRERPALCSFGDGVEALPRALGQSLGDSLHREARVVSVRRGKADGRSCFEIAVDRGGHSELLQAGAVVIATPTAPAGEILRGISEEFAAAFVRIEYAPVAVVAAGYRREQVAHPAQGFGFLVPRTEGITLLGTVWNSYLFPGRAPQGTIICTSFAGGAMNPGLLDKSEPQIAEIVGGEVARVLGITGAPVTQCVQCIPRALPQYNLGHAKIIAPLAALRSAAPGLFLAGNYLTGPSIGACIEQANRTADAVSAYLGKIGVASAKRSLPA